MSGIPCPSCGEALTFDVLSGEPMACASCGVKPAVDQQGHFVPGEAHQLKLNRQKYFEIATVITLILVGFGYLAISIGNQPNAGDGTTTISNQTSILLSANFDQQESVRAMDRRFDSFSKQGDTLLTTVDLISADGVDSAEAVIFSVGIPEEEAMPSVEDAEKMVQEAFDAVADLGERLVPTSTDGLSKAVNTTVVVSEDGVRFMKGVAQTASGWKITYLAYREVDDDASPVPLLLFLYQRLDAASNPDLEAFNGILFGAANDGLNIRQAMLEASTNGE